MQTHSERVCLAPDQSNSTQSARAELARVGLFGPLAADSPLMRWTSIGSEQAGAVFPCWSPQCDAAHAAHWLSVHGVGSLYVISIDDSGAIRYGTVSTKELQLRPAYRFEDLLLLAKWFNRTRVNKVFGRNAMGINAFFKTRAFEVWAETRSGETLSCLPIHEVLQLLAEEAEHLRTEVSAAISEVMRSSSRASWQYSHVTFECVRWACEPATSLIVSRNRQQAIQVLPAPVSLTMVASSDDASMQTAIEAGESLKEVMQRLLACSSGTARWLLRHSQAIPVTLSMRALATTVTYLETAGIDPSWYPTNKGEWRTLRGLCLDPNVPSNLRWIVTHSLRKYRLRDDRIKRAADNLVTLATAMDGYVQSEGLLLQNRDGWKSILEPMSYDAVRESAQLRTALNDTVTVDELQNLIVEGLNRDLASAVGRYASWVDWMWDQIQLPTPDLGCDHCVRPVTTFASLIALGERYDNCLATPRELSHCSLSGALFYEIGSVSQTSDLWPVIVCIGVERRGEEVVFDVQDMERPSGEMPQYEAGLAARELCKQLNCPENATAAAKLADIDDVFHDLAMDFLEIQRRRRLGALVQRVLEVGELTR